MNKKFKIVKDKLGFKILYLRSLKFWNIKYKIWTKIFVCFKPDCDILPPRKSYLFGYSLNDAKQKIKKFKTDNDIKKFENKEYLKYNIAKFNYTSFKDL